MNLLLQDPVFLGLPGLSLALFVGSLGSQSVNLALPVGCLLLQFAEALDFLLLLVSDSLGLNCCLLLLLDLPFVVLDYFLLFKLLQLNLLLLLLLGDSVCSLDFLLNLLVALLFELLLLLVLLLALLDHAHHLSLLLFDGLPLFHPLHLSLFDLVNDHSSSSPLGLDSGLLFLLSGLKALESFDLHHQVELLLFIDPFLLQALVLLKLLVSDRDDFRIQHHLVHVLDVVQLFV